MRARRLLSVIAVTLTLGACARSHATEPSEAAPTTTGSVAAATDLTYERHFGTSLVGERRGAATGVRRPVLPPTHRPWSDDEARDEVGIEDPATTGDDEWTDDEWTDDDGTYDDGTYDDEWTDDLGPVVPPMSSEELSTALADLRTAWSAAVPGTVATVVVVPSGQRVSTACADDSVPYATSDDAFYCDLDDTIVIGADVLSEVQSQFGAGGVAFLLAHEYAHNLQIETGVDDADSDTAKPSELHADCLAGAYLRDALGRGTIDASALDQARGAAYSVGDDDVNDPDHHGTSQERLAALDAGLAGADCRTFVG